MNNLPEKFYTDVTEESLEWLNRNKQTNYVYHGGIEGYYLYPMYNYYHYYKMRHSIPTDYKYLTPSEFNKLINMKEKKIIGYKYRRGGEYYHNAVVEIIRPHPFENNFKTDSIIAKKLKEALVLDVWFDPIYEEEKEERILYIGDTKTEVIISKECIKSDGRYTSIDDVREFYKKFKELQRYGPWSIFTVKVGCCNISIPDLDLIIKEYDKINS